MFNVKQTDDLVEVLDQFLGDPIEAGNVLARLEVRRRGSLEYLREATKHAQWRVDK